MSGWEQAEHILCVRLDALGDVLMTTPALRALKAARAGRRLTLLTAPAGAEVAALIPEIDDVIAYEAPWMKATAPRRDAAVDLAIIDRLRAGRFDAAIIFTVFSQSPLPAALLCYLAGIPLRLAYCRENPYQLLSDHVPETEPQQMLRHEVRRHLDLAAAIGAGTASGDEHLSLAVPAEARRRTATLLDEIGIDQHRPWVLIHPGATAPSRRYPPELYARVAARLAAEDHRQIVLSGRETERVLVDSIRAAMGQPSWSVAGRLDLASLAALVEAAPVMITNNTGPAHIAAATGTPVVVLYALTNPQHTPWSARSRVLFHDVPCRSCYKSICPEGHHDCLRLVTPDAVVAAVRELAGTASGARRDGHVPDAMPLLLAGAVAPAGREAR